MTRLHNRSSTKRRRLALRRRPTVAEAMLWKRLRRRQLDGRKFRRQHSIGRYIVDFYCAEERLVIELDGAVHDDPLRAQVDTQRQRWLEAQGLRVLRFQNEEVMRQSEVVLAAIGAVLGLPLPPAPSPRRGAGESLAPASDGTAEASINLSPAPHRGEGAGGRGGE